MAEYPTDSTEVKTEEFPETRPGKDRTEDQFQIVPDAVLTNRSGFEAANDVPEDYVPEGYKTVLEYLEDVRETYEYDIETDAVNRREAMEDKKFSAGEQWDPVVLQHRQGLPCLVINTIPQFTAQLVGDWRTNRNGIKVVPAENGDVDVASVRTDLIRAIETDSRATRVYDSAFESVVQCGDGAFQIVVEYAADDVFDQEIRIRPIDDALSVVWDRTSLDPTGRDATHCFVDEPLPRKEFDKIWPGHDPSTLGRQFYHDLRASGWYDEDIVRVTAHWRMIERNRLLTMFSDGQIIAIDKDHNLDDLIDKHGLPIRSRVAPCKYAQMHLVTGFCILSGPYEYKLNRLPIIRMVGRVVNVNGRRTRHGLVRFMKDVVRMKNFWRSVASEQLGYAPKAQWIATESAVEGREDTIRKAHLTRDPLVVINDDAIIGQNIQRLDPPPIQAALLNEAQINTQDMKDVTGIHDASLGINGNETSGRAIMARQREGDVASLTYYDNGNAAILEAGDVINQLIPQIYDATRVIRIIGEDESIKLKKINDPYDPSSPDLATGKYDVAMTTGPSYTTRRVEAADAMMQAVQVWPQLISVAGDIIAKAQDWPGAQELATRLQKTIPPQYLDGEKDADGNVIHAGPTPEQVQQLQQGLMETHQKLQETTAENQQLKTKAAVDIQKNQIDMYNAETQRIVAMGKISERDRDRPEAIANARELNQPNAPS